MCVKSAIDYMEEVFDLYEEEKDAEKKITIENDAICIHVKPIYDYYIYLSDCTTVTGALNWIEHIRHKTWMTDVMLSRVIRLMVEHNGGQFDE